jgi:hypothetical protein
VTPDEVPQELVSLLLAEMRLQGTGEEQARARGALVKVLAWRDERSYLTAERYSRKTYAEQPWRGKAQQR